MSDLQSFTAVPPPGAAASMPPVAPASPVQLDAKALAGLHALDPGGQLGVVQRVLATYDSSLDRMLQQLAAQRVDGDASVVADLAHTIKSASASVGALRLSQACGEIERRLRSQVPGNLTADVERLLAEGMAALAAVRPMLKA